MQRLRCILSWYPFVVRRCSLARAGRKAEKMAHPAAVSGRLKMPRSRVMSCTPIAGTSLAEPPCDERCLETRSPILMLRRIASSW